MKGPMAFVALMTLPVWACNRSTAKHDSRCDELQPVASQPVEAIQVNAGSVCLPPGWIALVRRGPKVTALRFGDYRANQDRTQMCATYETFLFSPTSSAWTAAGSGTVSYFGSEGGHLLPPPRIVGQNEIRIAGATIEVSPGLCLSLADKADHEVAVVREKRIDEVRPDAADRSWWILLRGERSLSVPIASLR
jgi:hypothetical protein